MTDSEKVIVLRNQMLEIRNNLYALNSKLDELSASMKSTFVVNNREFKMDELNNLKNVNNVMITQITQEVVPILSKKI